MYATESGIDTAVAIERITQRERYLLLDKVLQIMFFTEFVLLTEFIEVFMPVMYSLYLVILFYWPNRHFYPQFDGLDEAQFWRKICNILVYGLLETIPAEWQTFAAALVSVFKIIQKNVYCRLLRGKDDVKPEVVTLNVDVANALFISSTMQNLQSGKSSVVLITLDIMQMLTSLFDLSRMIKEIRETTNEEIDQAIASALLIAHKYPELREESVLPTRPFPSRSDIFKVQKIKTTTDYIASRMIKEIRETTNEEIDQAIASALLIAHKYPELREESVLPTRPFPSRSDIFKVQKIKTTTDYIASPTRPLNFPTGTDHTTVALVDQMTPQQRHLLLHKILQIMFFVEFFLLGEFVKALIPAVYSCYLVLLFHWPNRRFYPQLEGLDEAGFWSDIAHIQIYGVLEAAIFMLLLWTLRRMIYNFAVQQLAYAVYSSWGKIQCKLVILTVLLLQSTIPQLGTDYTFKFEWIHKK
ncbi:uncharacterized protein IUM83_11872 [Phytophthora cinnamomi]|uniref:uncharacterized protein n=1 Tax=Phytophthora cinnamomi TaxID=4785 RepID=UPI00355990E3|nr:hypothetical protein IUM83_11872 [Phytophthora cinnamomi]